MDGARGRAYAINGEIWCSVGSSKMNQLHSFTYAQVGTVPDPQDLERDIQLSSTRLPSTLDEGTRKSQPLPESTTKTTPRPEGSCRDKDSVGNKPPADMKPQNPTDADLSGTNAKYQEDETQSSRLRYQSVTKNEGEPSYEGDPDNQPMLLTYADVRAILLSGDEAQESEEDILGAGKCHVCCLKEAVVHYVNLKGSIDDYNNKNIAYIDQTSQLVKASMSSLKQSSSTITNLYESLEFINQLLKDILNSVKDDPTINKKIEEAYETVTKISTHTSEILSLDKSFDFSTLQSTMKNIQDHAFKGQSSLAPSSSVTPTFALTDTPTNVEGENSTHITTKEPPSHIEGETNANIQDKPEEPKKGKGIETDDQAEDQRKLVKALSIVHPDPDEPWDKEEEIKKVKAEARLNVISKTKVIKVVREEAKKLGIHLKEVIITKAGKLFKKAQEAEHEVLKRQHTEKVRKSLELRKHNYDSYMWTISSILKQEPITGIKIHLKTKPIVITVYRGTYGRSLDVHKPFLFGAFSISELDELWEIIPKKKNPMSALRAPEKAPSQTPGRKQKHMELEPETRIIELECNRTLPENVPFVNNMVIKEPEYGIFFTNKFGDQAFQRWGDIDKVGIEALVSYLVAASWSSLLKMLDST
uniref:Copia protein n=1 Tax=Tanacetum cinerariifolium TaxID=118510 RepID=A0A699I9X6_TANCI|nr:copia protein [Tanacetum cinerariifolium]